MLTLTMTQALYMAGVSERDSDFERDLKFDAWIADRKYRILDQPDREDATDAEIFIIKDKNGKQSRHDKTSV